MDDNGVRDTQNTAKHLQWEWAIENLTDRGGSKRRVRRHFLKPIIVRMNVGDENIRVCVGDVNVTVSGEGVNIGVSSDEEDITMNDWDVNIRLSGEDVNIGVSGGDEDTTASCGM